MFASTALAPSALEARDSIKSGAIKLLDLLTNRYHCGIVRETSAAEMQVEVPASTHFQAGQRVRFVVAGQENLVSKTSMQRGFITNVSPHRTNRLNVQLALVLEPAAG